MESATCTVHATDFKYININVVGTVPTLYFFFKAFNSSFNAMIGARRFVNFLT
jgi:hypothetical protein